MSFIPLGSPRPTVTMYYHPLIPNLYSAYPIHATTLIDLFLPSFEMWKTMSIPESLLSHPIFEQSHAAHHLPLSYYYGDEHLLTLYSYLRRHLNRVIDFLMGFRNYVKLVLEDRPFFHKSVILPFPPLPFGLGRTHNFPLLIEETVSQYYKSDPITPDHFNHAMHSFEMGPALFKFILEYGCRDLPAFPEQRVWDEIQDVLYENYTFFHKGVLKDYKFVDLFTFSQCI